MKNYAIDTWRKCFWVSATALFVLYSLNCFAILPLYNMLASDVLYASNLVVINLISLLSEIVEIIAISVFYAALLLVVYRYGSGRAGGMAAMFALITIYKYSANTAISWGYEGEIPSSWAWDAVNVVFYTALEMLQLLIIILFVKSVITKYTERRDMRLRAAQRAGEAINAEDGEVYPFTSVYSKSNCLLRSAFICAVITFIAKGVGALVSDVWLIVLYGLPEDASTWLLMLLNYASKVIFGLVVYFITVAAMNALHGKQQNN